ncbi:hypothetical protein EVAR_39861_1 [Eumeta japonica]|uniref:Uncharacterized protein n=1 Tax=Eumeta variegata TaxID=151549 RepID=A0A4C1WU68_EUMVA|nr:hypothetical protein EVAR_39861_1 [Eumeta japonica]
MWVGHLTSLARSRPIRSRLRENGYGHLRRARATRHGPPPGSVFGLIENSGSPLPFLTTSLNQHLRLSISPLLPPSDILRNALVTTPKSRVLKCASDKGDGDNLYSNGLHARLFLDNAIKKIDSSSYDVFKEMQPTKKKEKAIIRVRNHMFKNEWRWRWDRVRRAAAPGVR